MRSIIKHTLLLFIILCMNNACSQQKKDSIEIINEFPHTINLSHERIETFSNLYSVVGILLLEDVLVAMDLKTDTIFQLLELPLFNNIGGFMTRGPGPEEELFIDPYIQRVSNTQFLYKNRISVKIMDIDLMNHKINLKDEIDLPTSIASLCHVFKLKENIIGCKTEEPTNKEFISYNIATNDISDFGADFPVVEKKIPSSDRNRIFTKANTVKPDGSAFACVYDKFPILRIYSNTGELKKEIRLKNNQAFPNALLEKSPSQSSINNIMQNYRMIKSTHNFIYALYIGKIEKDIDKGFNDFSNEIHVWDWDGTPVQKILLDNNIFTFDVHENDDYLICSSLESLDAFYKYKLK